MSKHTLQARSLVLTSRTAGLFFVLAQGSAFQNNMDVGGKLSPPIHPNRNGWKPTDDGLPVRKLCAPGANPEGMPVRCPHMRPWTGMSALHRRHFLLSRALMIFVIPDGIGTRTSTSHTCGSLGLLTPPEIVRRFCGCSISGIDESESIYLCWLGVLFFWMTCILSACCSSRAFCSAARRSLACSTVSPSFVRKAPTK